MKFGPMTEYTVRIRMEFQVQLFCKGFYSISMSKSGFRRKCGLQPVRTKIAAHGGIPISCLSRLVANNTGIATNLDHLSIVVSLDWWQTIHGGAATFDSVTIIDQDKRNETFRPAHALYCCITVLLRPLSCFAAALGL